MKKLPLLLILLSLALLVAAADSRDCKVDESISIPRGVEVVRMIDEQGNVLGGFGLGDKDSITLKVSKE